MLSSHREGVGEAAQPGCIAGRMPGGFCPRAVRCRLLKLRCENRRKRAISPDVVHSLAAQTASMDERSHPCVAGIPSGRSSSAHPRATLLDPSPAPLDPHPSSPLSEPRCHQSVIRTPLDPRPRSTRRCWRRLSEPGGDAWTESHITGSVVRVAVIWLPFVRVTR